MTELELQRLVITGCRDRRLPFFHLRDRTRGEGRGFPDLVVCGSGRLLFRELKSQFGGLSSDQTAWRYNLLAAGQDYDIWRPDDWTSGKISAELDVLTPRR